MLQPDQYLHAFSELPDRIIRSYKKEYQIVPGTPSELWLIENYRIRYKQIALYLVGLLGLAEVIEPNSKPVSKRFIFDPVYGHLIDQKERFSISFDRWYLVPSEAGYSIGFKDVYTFDFKGRRFADGAVSELSKEIMIRAELSLSILNLTEYIWNNSPRPRGTDSPIDWWFRVEEERLNDALKQSFIESPKIVGKRDYYELASSFLTKKDPRSENYSLKTLKWRPPLEALKIQQTPSELLDSYAMGLALKDENFQRKTYQDYLKAEKQYLEWRYRSPEAKFTALDPDGQIIDWGTKIPKKYDQFRQKLPRLQRGKGFGLKGDL